MPTLAEELTRLRAMKGWTLRQVEEKTQRKVSNSYLYQLESGAVKEPSPNVLFELASAYGASYPGLMTLAGYVVPRRAATPGHQAVAFNAMNLTPEEEQDVLDFVQFRRQQRQKQG
jgi:HTH-type transcriptional regulator, competence development regulator